MDLLKQTFESFNPRFMETKHTKGPWKIGKSLWGWNIGIVSLESEEKGFSFDKIIAKSIEREEDAKLIAAAPELLEALNIAAKAWRDLAEATGEVGLLDEDVAYQAILSAINKAEF